MHRNARGFTLVEIVMSLFVIGVVIVLATSFIKTEVLARHAKFESTALFIASSKLEALRYAGYASTTSGGTFADSQLSLLPSGQASFAVSDYNAGTKKVTVTVSWREEGSTSVSSTTVTTLITNNGGFK